VDQKAGNGHEGIIRGLVTESPKARTILLAEAQAREVSAYEAEQTLKRLAALGEIFQWPLPRNAVGYATKAPPKEQPVPAPGMGGQPSPAEQLLRESRELSNEEIARRSGASLRHVQRLRSRLGPGTPPGA
jgi:hypothetical protein